MNRLNLEIVRPSGSTPCVFEVSRVVNAGYVGRDEAAVRRHIEELQHEGVAPPPSVPMLFPVFSANVTTAEQIETIEPKTSGEVEFVLLMQGESMLVGIGSDHTDRPLEAVDLIKSKQACPNVLGRSVWDFEDVRGHWDDLLLQSWTRATPANDWTLYQSAAAAAILPPLHLLELVRARLSDHCIDGMAIFSGTIPIVGGKVIYGSGFRCTLADPVLERSLHCAYEIVHLDYLGSEAPVAEKEL
jgi:hypothetical protein